MSIRIRRLDTAEPGFPTALDAIVHWDVSEDDAINAAARDIIDDVRERGDAALLECTRRFDRLTCRSMVDLVVDPADLRACLDAVGEADRRALEGAADRIRRYHGQQKQAGFETRDEWGNRLGMRVTPLNRVGIYVPGGQASYPSSVLMTVIPAQVAGVRDIVVTVPTPDGVRNAWVLAALALTGVECVYTIGGAQAIAALAYGTQTIRRVDKIVGPGGAFVAAAKRLVFGPVGIDSIAGPSEILIIADGSAPPEWMALDLFSQAEHDAAAQAILLCPDPDYIDAVEAAMSDLIGSLARRDVIRKSLAARGALIRTRDLAEAVAIANRIAPEHLQLAVAEPDAWLSRVENAGAIFLGAHSAESLGDYAAGPSHVLPTFGTARFASPLGVYDFQKRTSLIGIDAAGAEPLARIASAIARGEGLDAHARAAEARMRGVDHNR